MDALELFEVVARLTKGRLGLVKILLCNLQVTAQIFDYFRVLNIAVQALFLHFTLEVYLFLQLGHFLLEFEDLRLLVHLIDESVTQALELTVCIFSATFELRRDLRVRLPLLDKLLFEALDEHVLLAELLLGLLSVGHELLLDEVLGSRLIAQQLNLALQQGHCLA